MIRARLRALVWIGVAATAAAAFALMMIRRGLAGLAPRPAAERPALLLLTSLPLVCFKA